MSWWELSDGSWLGDGPADAVGAAVRQAIRESRSGPVELPRLLASIAAALATVQGLPGPPTVIMDPDGASSERAEPVPPLVEALIAAFEAAADDYRRAWDRDATQTELAATVLFCAAPDRDVVREASALADSTVVVR